MAINFPGSLDDATTLSAPSMSDPNPVTDGTTELAAARMNALRDAALALEAKAGATGSAVLTSHSYRIENGRFISSIADTGDAFRLLWPNTRTSGNLLVLGLSATFPNVDTTKFVVDFAGAVTTGSWSGTAIAATRGGTGQTTTTAGDLLYGGAGNTWNKLGIGAAGTFLRESGGNPAWFDLFGTANTWAAKQTLSDEIEIDGPLNHDGTTVGFFGVAPTTRPSALTQTYATADRTLSGYTPDDESGAYTGIDNAQGGTVYATVADLNALRTAYENLRALGEDLAQFVNALVDDLQLNGLEQ